MGAAAAVGVSADAGDAEAGWLTQAQAKKALGSSWDSEAWRCAPKDNNGKVSQLHLQRWLEAEPGRVKTASSGSAVEVLRLEDGPRVAPNSDEPFDAGGDSAVVLDDESALDVAEQRADEQAVAFIDVVPGLGGHVWHAQVWHCTRGLAHT